VRRRFDRAFVGFLFVAARALVRRFATVWGFARAGLRFARAGLRFARAGMLADLFAMGSLIGLATPGGAASAEAVT
jgi:hypothetical protein